MTGTQENISISAGSQSPGLYHNMAKLTTPLTMLQIMKIVATHRRSFVREASSLSFPVFLEVVKLPRFLLEIFS